jgi:hypothetical protein
VRADAGQEQFFQGIAETLDRCAEWKPFDSSDVLHQFVTWPGFRPHEPELHHLWPATCLVGHEAQKFTHLYPEPGFLHNLASGASDWTFVPLQLPARQHPEFVLAALNDGDPGPRAPAYRNSTHRVYGPTHKQASLFAGSAKHDASKSANRITFVVVNNPLQRNDATTTLTRSRPARRCRHVEEEGITIKSATQDSALKDAPLLICINEAIMEWIQHGTRLHEEAEAPA